MNPKFLQMLGLATRAGKVITGEERVVLGIRKNQVHLVILSEDASGNTVKKVTDKSKTYQVPVVTVGSRYDLGRSIGKDQRVVVGVTDIGFSKKIMSLRET